LRGHRPEGFKVDGRIGGLTEEKRKRRESRLLRKRNKQLDLPRAYVRPNYRVPEILFVIIHNSS
jgi:hypothetical protein